VPLKARIGFVIEQALGHVAYGIGLKRVLTARDDMESVWLDVPFAREGLGRIPLLGRNWTLRGSARAHEAIRRARRERPLDALFIHTQTVSIFSTAHMREVPTLLSLDATPLNYDELAGSYGDRVHARPVEQAKLWVHRRIVQHAAEFTTWSAWAKQSLVDDYGAPADKVTVIHPGTILENFPAVDRSVRRSGPLRVLFVGGDFKRKGGDLLLEVFRTRLRGKVELHLVTAAEIPKAEGVFVYHGLKPHSPELLERYREADVFALPTRGDCLAMVLGEAMASALPIITTRVGAHSEAVEDGRSGFLIDVDDEDALVDRLERLAANRELAVQLGRRSREIGAQRFDMERNANRIADLLLEIAHRGRGKRAAG
jgi:glycosyltransferase involved in cell wall biosynthesis